jgi:predicted DNA-binding transcriptional regulator YafY
MEMDNLTRTRMWRLMQLDRRIRSGDYPNCSSFARELAELTGMKQPYDRKTIQRDIDFLRDQMRAPVEYDQTRKGYFYRDRTWSFPMLDLTEGELLQLLLAEQMARQFEGTPLAETLDGLFDKIRFNLSESVPVDPVIARQQFSFHGHPVRPIKRVVWESIFRAMRGDRVIAICYRGIGDNKASSRDVEPLHLACVDGEWYLVAHCRSRNDLRHFAVSRIESVKVRNEIFDPCEFDPDEYFSNRFGRFIGPPDEEQWVTMKFAASAAPWILEREWHPKQKIKKHKDGSLTLSFPAPSLFEAKRWVLQWGAEAEVTEPEKLHEELKKEVGAMVEALHRSWAGH